MRKTSTVNLFSLTPVPDKMNKKTRGRANARIVIVIAAWLVMSAAALQAETPAPDGHKLLAEHCGRCHGYSRATGKHKSRGEWQFTVDRMNNKGAGLTPEEKAFLVDYLGTNYGSK